MKKWTRERTVHVGELYLTSSESVDYEGQYTIVAQVLSIVSMDTPFEAVRQISKLSKFVVTCVRNKDESLSIYISLFTSHAHSYLNLINSPQDGKDSHTFAVTLLTNARVASQVFTIFV